MPGQLTLQAKLDQVTGDSDVLAALRITLCNFGTFIPHIIGTSTVAKGQYLAKQISSSSPASVKLWGNDVITPDTTFYCIEVIDSRGVVIQAGNYRLTGTGLLDLSNLLPFLSPSPPPILPPLIVNELLAVGAADNMNFPGDTFSSFVTVLPGDVTNPTISGMVPGNLYTFIIHQDATGGHRFFWPANVYNATAIDPEANSTTIQTFVADENGTLSAIAPGTWY